MTFGFGFCEVKKSIFGKKDDDVRDEEITSELHVPD